MLTLTILRCPDAVPPETRTASGGEYTIGRGPDNDWVLPDPDRHLSKSHCVLRSRTGGWHLFDLSANGTFLNGESAPIGVGASRPVTTGDRLMFGSYEIEVAVVADPFLHGPRARPALQPGAAPDLPPLPEEDSQSGFPGPTQDDHGPAISTAFLPLPQRIPGDWNDAPPPPVSPRAETDEAPLPPPAPSLGASQTGASQAGAGQAGAASDDVLLGAFLRGAGLPDARLVDAARTLEGAGAALRAMVSGLRSALIARAFIKNEFRIEQTMVRPSGNNPLKFSAGDDDALAALLGAGRYSGMTPAAAVEDALRDMRLHEVASVAAMQHAVRELLAELDPGRVSRQVKGSRVQIRRKARAWDAFEATHARVTQALSDDFDSVFGKAFARAYEQALREAEDQEQRDVESS